MKKDLMDILACPVCKGDLELRSEEEEDNDLSLIHISETTRRYAISYAVF